MGTGGTRGLESTDCRFLTRRLRVLHVRRFGLFDDDLDAVADRMDEAFTRNLVDFSRTKAEVAHLPKQETGPDMVFYRSRLGESNPGPTHYECVALAN
jgi:hypothetical protein